MLAPQFSLRSILAAMVLCGFASLIGATALRGAPWARAVMLGLAALLLILLIHGLMFFVMWAFSLIVPARWLPAPGQSPFAPHSDAPPSERIGQPVMSGQSVSGQSPFAAATNKNG